MKAAGDLDSAKIDESAEQRLLRLWPGVTLVILQLLGMYVVPVVEPDATMYGIMGGLGCGLLVGVWWMFFSRALWLDRLVAAVVTIAAMGVVPTYVHESIKTGAMGALYYISVMPLLSLVFVVWAILSRRSSNGLRRVTMVVTILLASGFWTVVRTDGMRGTGGADYAWRWSETSENKLLAHADEESLQTISTVSQRKADWPSFRGANRDGIIHGTQIKPNWSVTPPVQIWRRSVGPGWSSFAISDNFFYTQEQRGDEETVACYEIATGKPVWRHSDVARFWESNGGAGPRGTPTLSGGRVYAFGATGILNALDAGDGSVVWSRNAAADTDTELPGWGFSSSPLVVDDLVIVATDGTLVAYEIATGKLRWMGPKNGGSYSSPHLLTIDGVEQILLMNWAGATSVSSIDGAQLWEHEWPGKTRIVQPALIEDGDILISGGESKGMRRIAIIHGVDGNWTTEERWTTTRLKPYFSDFVIHGGHAYGFNSGVLACIDIENGNRKWKGGRYGSGQLVLLADQDLLLVLSEQGELALAKATPDGFEELALFPAVEGKTWNHPVLVGDVLLVRNDREMVAFRL